MIHTPGPWNIWRIGKHKIPAIANNNSGEKPPVDICTLDENNDNREADALLIAAAPDLLAALEEIYRLGGQFGKGQQMAEIARVAITKAKGEQP